MILLRPAQEAAARKNDVMAWLKKQGTRDFRVTHVGRRWDAEFDVMVWQRSFPDGLQ